MPYQVERSVEIPTDGVSLDDKAAIMSPWPHSGGVPGNVVLVGLGPSHDIWVKSHFNKQQSQGVVGTFGAFDEVWVINRALKVLQHDVAFVLDDMRTEALSDPDYGRWLETHERPIITSIAYPEYPAAVEYPLLEVMRDTLGPDHAYLHNSVPMIIAYAKHVGVRQLTLIGCDYDYPGTKIYEANRGNAEYMIAWARAGGMRVGIPDNSALCNANQPFHVYGRLSPPADVVHWLREEAAKGDGSFEG